MLYIIDSYAWVEYFIGSVKGEVLKKLFSKESNEFLTLECCLAEIQGWALRNNKDFNELFKVIRANSDIFSVSEMDWIEAGKERFEQRKRQRDFGLIDACILVKRNEKNCQIISGDKHFKGMKKVVFMD
jgi:predicted nucleic acid-binding protein